MTDKVALTGAVASAVSAIATVGGLVFVWLQLRANRAVMLANLDAQVYSRLDAVNAVLLDHHDIEKQLSRSIRSQGTGTGRPQEKSG